MEMEMEGSLNLVLRYNSPPYFANIVKIDLNHLPENPTSIDGTYTGMPEMMETEMEFPHPPPPIKYLARLKLVVAEPLDWKVCSLAATGGGCSVGITPADHHHHLCVFPDGGTGRYAEDNPLSGSILNLRTGDIEKLIPHAIPKHLAYLVSLKGDIYSFSDPAFSRDESSICLSERYCVEKKCWEPLKPYPLELPAEVMGYAAFDDFIVFNMLNNVRFQLVAYDCSSGNWHEVAVDSRKCYGFRGLGVVVKTSLYAFKPLNYSIIELSITRGPSDDNDGGVAFSCRVVSEFDLFQTYRHPNLVMHDETGSEHLVYLGRGLDFCLVRSGYFNRDYSKQELRIMVLRLDDEHKLATLIHVMGYKIKQSNYRICHLFLLPPSDLGLDASDEKDESREIDFDIRNVNLALEAKAARLNREREAKEWYSQDIYPPEIPGLGQNDNPALEAGSDWAGQNMGTDWASQNMYPPEITGLGQDVNPALEAGTAGLGQNDNLALEAGTAKRRRNN